MARQDISAIEAYLAAHMFDTTSIYHLQDDLDGGVLSWERDNEGRRRILYTNRDHSVAVIEMDSAEQQVILRELPRFLNQLVREGTTISKGY